MGLDTTSVMVPVGRKRHGVFCALRQQIEDNAFSSGQQFYTVKEICDKHHVSTSTASRCLNQLEAEGLIVRRHRSGTYIKNSPLRTTRVADVGCIDYVMPEDIVSRGGPEFLADELLAGTSGSKDSYELILRINLLPNHVKTEEQIEEWLGQRVNTGARAFVFRWMPAAVQRVAQRNGWPTCILGTPARGIDLPHIGFDKHQLGKCVAEYLTQRGCQHVAVLMFSEWWPDDNVLVKSLMAGLGGRLVTIESVPPSEKDVNLAVEDMMSSEPQIDAIFLRNHLGPQAFSRLHELVNGPRKLIVVSARYRDETWITPIVPVGQSRVEAITSLLRRLIAGEPVSKSETYPAQILEPSWSKTARVFSTDQHA
ncbi:MAG: GntR family transcriptional regulator [Phycisphaeraceae bacterium]|nr:GntR family transcriptional regulator [Phycisphaeraceae bacterium]